MKSIKLNIIETLSEIADLLPKNIYVPLKISEMRTFSVDGKTYYINDNIKTEDLKSFMEYLRGQDIRAEKSPACQHLPAPFDYICVTCLETVKAE